MAVTDKIYQGYFPTKRGQRKHPRIFHVNGVRLTHVVLHSESLMTWGDTSNTSADLALSLLWNHFYVPSFRAYLYPITVNGQEVLVSRESERAFLLYMPFLREVVAHWPVAEPWQITTAEIAAWVEQHPVETLPVEEQIERTHRQRAATRERVTYHGE